MPTAAVTTGNILIPVVLTPVIHCHYNACRDGCQCDYDAQPSPPTCFGIAAVGISPKFDPFSVNQSISRRFLTWLE